MDIRYSANQRDVKRYTTEELRDEFLIQDLYHPDEVVSVYSHVDRMVTLGCMPVKEHVSIEKGIDCWKNFGTHYFLERARSESSISEVPDPSQRTEWSTALAIKTACTSQKAQRK
mgnify:CR=1 FL=1